MDMNEPTKQLEGVLSMSYAGEVYKIRLDASGYIQVYINLIGQEEKLVFDGSLQKFGDRIIGVY